MHALRLLLLVFCLSGVAGANPTLGFLNPAGGQRGTQVEVTFIGDGMADVKSIVFYDAGITVAEIIERKDKMMRVRFKIAADCRLGPHLLRLFGKDQFSKAIAFAVGQFPEKFSDGKNLDFTTAETVTMNHTINGILEQEVVNYYKITLHKNELLNTEMEANRLAYGFFDCQMTIYDPNKAIAAECDDTVQLGLDPYLSYLAPRDGTYYIAVRNSEYDGHANARYRLHLGTYPRPEVVYPLGGQRGQDTQISYILANGGVLKDKIHIPDQCGTIKLFASNHGIFTPSGVAFQVSPWPTFHSTMKCEKKAEVSEFPHFPVVFDGVIDKPHTGCWFGFTAKKGDKVTVRVFGRELRSPIDPFLAVGDVDSIYYEQDDHYGPDPELEVDVRKDGKQYIDVTDTLMNWGPAYAFRVSVIPTVGHIRLVLASSSGGQEIGQALTIPRGGRRFRMIDVDRRDTKGKDTINFGKLPIGVSAQVLEYPENASEIPVMFSASDSADENYFLIRPTITSGNGLKGGFYEKIDMNHGDNDRSFYHVELDSLTLGVGEKPPFQMVLQKSQAPLPRMGKHDVHISVIRDPGFAEEIQVRLIYKQNDMNSVDRITIPKDQSSIVYQIEANNSVPEGDWPLVFVATGRRDAMMWEVTSDIYRVKVISNFLDAAVAPQSFRQATSGMLNITLKQKKAFVGSVTAKVLGLPDGITARETTLTSASKQVSFALAISPDAKVGAHQNLRLELNIPFEGTTLTQDIYLAGGIRVDASDAKDGGAKK